VKPNQRTSMPKTLTKQEILFLKNQARLELARRDLWEYSSLLSPEFYREDREHLINLCDTLTKFFKGKLLDKDGIPYRKLMINMPPQHGKSRTFVNFCDWILGNAPNQRIILGSYNDNTAQDFSKYVRDAIQEVKKLDEQVVYSDIFPDTKIKRGSSSYEKWALEGQHFNYLGAGVGGSVTGKGGTVLIVDDPIKNAAEALNENVLKKIWEWYTGTFISRVSAEGGQPLEVIIMTRWAKGDLCGRILDSEDASKWYVLCLTAYDKAKDKMLCESLLNKERYEYLKRNMTAEIFEANYDQKPIDVKGRLYQAFKTYTEIPKDEKGNILFESIKNYTDTADQGSDYLVSINYGVYRGEGYILDVLCTKEAMEVTEPATAKMLFDGGVNEAKIESNNGGRGFARNVERILREKYNTLRTSVKWFHQSQNKRARIISNSSFVVNHLYFPVNWKDRWPEYYTMMNSYQKEGGNIHDDPEDATTGVAENIQKPNSIEFLT